ncbi:MAG: GlsB/YeaQ/YmgE family stress response membrane protein [Candidatus Andersenbacteria bacterium CG10_big_fil_rev_8_21_14_0_10_54_11]|uniref:GlsB/YeaQ/YmgE family stress response membrane protein n=1 Tax=Candidatus Andersenbacteria bacterium CG10_big_fil_rev_8_21_14_0_10_54_11 TaxID=1974485 RepID=A0A2M6WYU0_9BACT|nr:MAG: GlsB/YeaQ/YmgE family stress response membrane protein [Candidatus Andersenbacteria bacterium CG10_big_fil_rev_8_21_14_0_10_54_11]
MVITNGYAKEVSDIPDFIWFLLIGVVAGWLAGLLMRGRGFGILGDMIIDIVGAVIGGLLFGAFGIGAGGLIGSLIMATIGVMIFLFIASLFQRGTRHPAV